MKQGERIKKEIMQHFGEAYRALGLNKLMGHIRGLIHNNDWKYTPDIQSRNYYSLNDFFC